MKSGWIVVDHAEFHAHLKNLRIHSDVLSGHWSSEHSVAIEDMNAVLEYRDGLVQLRPLDKSLGNSVVVDFSHGKTGFRSQRAQHEMIVKAVVGRSKEPLSVIDATAGLGRDSFILAAGGCSVTAIERHPAVYCLLVDGLARASLNVDSADAASRVTPLYANAVDYLASLTVGHRPDVIYLDPMFPERTKSALVKKEMRLFRDVVGEDQDANALFLLARTVAKKRVVVKRPRKASFIGELSPAHQITGKSSRFDVYPV